MIENVFFYVKTMVKVKCTIHFDSLVNVDSIRFHYFMSIVKLAVS